MCARLEDKGYPPWDVARLTPYQTRHICAHPRDEHGRVIAPKKGGQAGQDSPRKSKGEAFQEDFLRRCRAAGMSAQQALDEYLRYLDSLA